MDGFKMVKLFLVLALAMTVASQPLETIGTSGEATQTNQLWNWVEVGWEELMDFAKRIIGCNTEEEETTTSGTESISTTSTTPPTTESTTTESTSTATTTTSTTESTMTNNNSGGTKVLVATGFYSGGNTEIIDVEDASFNCTVSQFPIGEGEVTGGLVGNGEATGGLVGDSPLICGGGFYSNSGWQFQKSCYSLKEDGTWKLESNLNTARRSAANGEVIINNKLVIAGGNNGYHRLDTIEVVAPNTRSRTLPIRLPVAMRSSCIVPWDTNTFFIIGGYSGVTRSQTYFFNMANNTYTNGPSLLTARSTFACHTMKINGEDFIIVAGGYGAFKSTEYLQKANYGSGWKKSVDLPVKLAEHAIVASKDNKVLYTIGNWYSPSDIYKFSCTNSITNCSWTKIPTQLQFGRWKSVAMTIPDTLANKLCS